MPRPIETGSLVRFTAKKNQAEVLGAEPSVVRTDHPAIGFTLTFLSLVGILVLGWRSR